MTTPAAAIISSLAPMSVTVQGGSATTVATEMMGVTLGIMRTIHHHSGNVMPTLVVVPGADRRIRVGVPFQAAFNLLGLGLTQLSALSVYLATFSQFNRQTGANHLMLSLTTACVAGAQITSWTVNVDGILMAVVDIILVSNDGATDPLTVTPSSALPAISGTPQLHTIGPVSFNGTIYSGAVATSGSIGSNPTLLRTDGDFFGRTAARLQAEPSLSVTHADPVTLVQALTTLGANISSVIAYFKAYDATTGMAEQTGGISITIALGRVHPLGPDTSQGQNATTGVEIIGICSDGATNPLAIATGVAVPTG